MRFLSFLITPLRRGGYTFCLTTLTVTIAALSMKIGHMWVFIIDWIIIIWNILFLTYKSATSIPFENKEEIKKVAKMMEEQEKENKIVTEL